jgi:hypothetical protein
MEKDALQHSMDNGVKDYNLLMVGNSSLLAEHNDFRYCCDNLEKELTEVHSDAGKRIADLEAKVKSTEARSVGVAAAGEKELRDFEGRLVRHLEELHELYVHNVETIRGLCSQMPTGEPPAEDYLRWLSTEVTGLPDMFSGVNENFAPAAIEGALTMDADSVDLPVV